MWGSHSRKVLLDDFRRSPLALQAFYSTPAQYTKAKHRSGLDWTVKEDDFFPYADCPVSLLLLLLPSVDEGTSRDDRPGGFLSSLPLNPRNAAIETPLAE